MLQTAARSLESLNKDHNQCWLKTRAGGQNVPSANGGLISVAI